MVDVAKWSVVICLSAIIFGGPVSVGAKENDQNVTIARIFRTQDKNHDGVLRDLEIETARRVVRGGLDVACDRIESHPRLRRIQPAFDRKRVFAQFADHKIDADEDGQVSEEEFSRFFHTVHGPIQEAQLAMQNGAPADMKPVDPGLLPAGPPAGTAGRSDRSRDRDRELDRERDRQERERRERQSEANERRRANEQRQAAAEQRQAAAEHAAAQQREARERQQQEQQRRAQEERRKADDDRRRDAERRDRQEQQQRRSLEARKGGR